MTITQRFMGYAAAFEKAYATDDWSRIEPFFTEDAVYETFAEPPFGNRTEGREAIKAFFKQSLDSFDRRFDSRAVEILDGPTERGDTVWFRWAATYTVAGAPALRFEGEEKAFFQGDRIRRLEDHIPAADGQRTRAYLEAHAAKLKPQPNR